MKYLFEKLRLLSVGVLAMSFLMAVTLSSCGTTTRHEGDDADATETVDEAPAADEHPAGEHPSGGEEEAADTTATEGHNQ